jgi:aryl-phospho-beta-D-glucosidase BglC (GH1 family)
VVRFSVNEVFWLDTAKGGLYQRTVQRAVKWALSLGMDAIIDLHWTGSGTTYGQMQLPVKGHGTAFWTSVANLYKNDGRVIFELYNEPFGDGATWRAGNGAFDGMQDLYNAVRNAGAKNLVLIGGLDYAFHLDQVLPANAITGTNIAYVTHPYQFKAASAAQWDPAFGNLAATYPIIATEFGQANISQPGGTQTCDANFYTTIINYFKTKNISWTAWAWHVERATTDPNATCGFPQVITGYSGTTNPAGAVVKTALGMP